MAQRAYSCTLKKGYARNVCAFTNYDTLTFLTRVLTFSYYHWCHASTELCLFFGHYAIHQNHQNPNRLQIIKAHLILQCFNTYLPPYQYNKWHFLATFGQFFQRSITKARNYSSYYSIFKRFSAFAFLWHVSCHWSVHHFILVPLGWGGFGGWNLMPTYRMSTQSTVPKKMASRNALQVNVPKI